MSEPCRIYAPNLLWETHSSNNRNRRPNGATLRRRTRTVKTLLLAALAAAAVLAGWNYPALGHDAIPTAAKPLGWKYPFSCCSGFDCREVSSKAVVEGSTGYTIKATGEKLAFGDTRLKDSPDGEFHWCSVAGADDSRTICLFVPPRGF